MLLTLSLTTGEQIYINRFHISTIYGNRPGEGTTIRTMDGFRWVVAETAPQIAQMMEAEIED